VFGIIDHQPALVVAKLVVVDLAPGEQIADGIVAGFTWIVLEKADEHGDVVCGEWDEVFDQAFSLFSRNGV
jgi:hypothetical protein